MASSWPGLLAHDVAHDGQATSARMPLTSTKSHPQQASAIARSASAAGCCARLARQVLRAVKVVEHELVEDLHVAAQVVRVGHEVVALALARALLEAQDGQLVAVGLLGAPLAPVLLQQLDGERVGVDRSRPG